MILPEDLEVALEEIENGARDLAKEQATAIRDAIIGAQWGTIILDIDGKVLKLDIWHRKVMNKLLRVMEDLIENW